MGTIHAEITLKNAVDEANARKGLIKEEEVRSVTVTSVVDTGAASLVINEELCQILGLGIAEERSVKMADGQRVPCKITEPVEIHWKDRFWACPSVVVAGAESVLLGAIPLEGMDIMINPKTQELVGVHGDVVEYMAY
ncbi:MAG: hypothetical protein LBH07_07585 [Treponema sp.]|nr:hypothetical protein [Treponema sp.]